MRSIGVLLVVAGCSFDGGQTSPDGSMMPDVPTPTLGMSLSWTARPALPGPISDKVTVTEAAFEVEHLQLVSDAGADDRTTRYRYQLVWNTSKTPGDESFPDAPVANYQRISLDLRPDIIPPFSYQIQGVWRDEENEMKSFRIMDTMTVDIPIDCSVILPAGGSVSVAVRLDLRDALNSIDFRNVPETGGMLLVSGGPQLMMFRSKLMRAFSSDD